MPCAQQRGAGMGVVGLLGQGGVEQGHGLLGLALAQEVLGPVGGGGATGEPGGQREAEKGEAGSGHVRG